MYLWNQQADKAPGTSKIPSSSKDNAINTEIPAVEEVSADARPARKKSRFSDKFRQRKERMVEEANRAKKGMEIEIEMDEGFEGTPRLERSRSFFPNPELFLPQEVMVTTGLSRLPQISHRKVKAKLQESKENSFSVTFKQRAQLKRLSHAQQGSRAICN